MSFGSGGGGGFSFGQNSNQSSGFGGFGSNSNTTGTGFGQSSNFGSNTTSNAFGGGGGFGSSTGGAFGSNANTGSSLFGQNKPTTGFGTTTSTSGGLFGNTSNTNTGFGSSTGGAFGNTANNTSSPFGGGSSTTFGGFGSNNANTTSAFGSSQNKPLFGAGGSGTTGGFGATSSPFGGGTATALGAVPPCQGTAEVAFQQFTEKEANGSTVNYQTITFMQPYQKYSLEELRLADYAAGRQFGNASGQSGAFGQSNFGGFGSNTSTGGAFGSTNTGGGLFGNTSTSGSAFGSNTATAGGFGSNTGGGLFGSQNKTGGLFGGQTTSTTSGGLFGTSNNTSAFGSNNQSGGGLFGSSNTNQNKPGGLFGSTNTGNTGTGFSFGNTNQQANTSTGGGLFGSQNTTGTGGGLFGNNTQQQSTGGGLFGNTNTNQQSGGLFGNKTGTTFGSTNTQAQPSGGLFGTSNNTSSGGLFGSNNATTNTGGGGLFGNTNNQQSGGLFGNNNQQKPGGLFGNNTTSTGGGLFGNTSTSNNQGGLFGGNTNQQQNTGGLFGTPNTNTGGGLFGNNQNNQNKPGLFGTSTTNNTQGSGLFGASLGSGGIFGQSQNNQQQQNPNQQEVKHASLLDPNPYGQSSIWTGLPTPNEQNSKPLFTPLTATKKLEESKMKPIPSLRLNQSRYMTPPRRNGYGLNYSTYGTPSSAASTPGAGPLSGSLYASRGLSAGGSFGRSFNRSASVQNLRSQYANDSDDIWKPNAFAPSHRNSSGSIKRLTIDKSIRQDLFNRPASVPALPAPKLTTNGESAAPPPSHLPEANVDSSKKLSKRVSWGDGIPETSLNGESGALVRTETSDDEASPPTRNGASSNGLPAVPEDRESHQVSAKSTEADATMDPQPGAYWMKPSRQQMAKMPRDQLKAFKGFQVGREGCGHVTFDYPVDLTKIDLDNLYGGIVDIVIRAITVYPDKAQKPPVGSGLNVPSILVIENSWPRAKHKPISDTSGPVVEKHIKRLKRIEGTQFVSYDRVTGAWTFRVEHYTRYGLDYDDDESEMDQSELSLPPQTIDKSADAYVMEVDEQTDSDYDEDDTFDFKRVPGQFGKRSIMPADEDTAHMSDDVLEAVDDHSEQSASSDVEEMSKDERSPPMPGSLPVGNPVLLSPTKPLAKPIMPGTPGKPLLDLEGDWAEQLQRTISPRKQNRDVLREAQSKILLDKVFSPIKPKPAAQVNFKSSIDIMNSMFKPANSRKSTKAAEPDFEFPYSKRSKTFHPDDEELSESDRRWHDSFKPHFTNDGRVVYRTTKPIGDRTWKEVPVAGDGQRTIVVGQQSVKKAFDLESALASSDVKAGKSVPAIQHRPTPFSKVASNIESEEVKKVYNLAHILFDNFEDEFTYGLSEPLQKKFMHRIRRDRLAQFLSTHNATKISAEEQGSPIRQAVLLLAAHDIPGAIGELKKQKNFRLALIVAQLDGADQAFMEDIKHQIDAWRTQKSLSEFDLDIRALYEICAGNVGISQGRQGKGVPVEDRAETFNLSTRYNLDWLQCFALGFFYGKQEKDNDEGIARIEDAVREYQARYDRGEEPVKPADDDVLWSLLKLYAAQKTDKVEAPSFPAAVGGIRSSWDHSDLFTFYNAITANLSVTTDTQKADELAETVASELSASGDVAGSIYALLHLSNADTRKTQIQDFLDRFGSSLPGPDTATSNEAIQLWQHLTMSLKIPQSWIYMSKARFAASSTNNGGDTISELRYLVAAEAWDQAHECLLKRVAPAFIIDEDWQGLLEMCGLFGDDPASRVAGWYEGGDVYASFAQLMAGIMSKTDTAAIAALRKRLVVLGNQDAKEHKVDLGRLSKYELEEHVAVKEMANGLARLRTQGVDVGSASEILEMPITSDVRGEIEMFENIKSTDSGSEKRTRRQGLGIRSQAPPQDQEDEEMGEAGGSTA